MVSSLPGMEYGDIFYKHLEIEKIHILKLNAGNFDAYMFISKSARYDIIWWTDNVGKSPKQLDRGIPTESLLTDASQNGWVGMLHSSGTRTGGRWSIQEQKCHINELELKAVQFGLHPCAIICMIHIF